MIRPLIGLLLVCGAIVGGGLGVSRGLRAVIDATGETEAEIPTTAVRRGDIAITVTARGELQGGVSESLTVPTAGAAELPITFLRSTGELVEAGDVVVEFDPSGQEYDLIEAEADLEEARQELIRKEAESLSALEEARLEVVTSQADLRISELEQRKNEFLGTIQQRQNEIALERARNHHEQAILDLEHLEATSDAGLEGQRAAVREAEQKAETARRTMANMTLRAPKAGYVQLAENTTGLSIIYSGMQIPTYQPGDAARPGQTVARIPDLSRYEVSTQIPETDRAFLELGQEVLVRPKAIPGREFRGHISLLGGATGNSWNRTFNCRVSIDEPAPDFRPGMSVDIVISVETLEDVLWIPSQAVFDRDGRWFVYQLTPEGYLTQEVTLVRRTESQAVIRGIGEGATVALARPDRPADSGANPGGPLGAIPQ